MIGRGSVQFHNQPVQFNVRVVITVSRNNTRDCNDGGGWVTIKKVVYPPSTSSGAGGCSTSLARINCDMRLQLYLHTCSQHRPGEVQQPNCQVFLRPIYCSSWYFNILILHLSEGFSF